MVKPTAKQMTRLYALRAEVEPEMILPAALTRHMAHMRIQWLEKKKANPKITKKLYMQ